MELLFLVFGFLLLVLIRVPIAFAMLPVALGYLWMADIPVNLLAQRVAGGVDSFSLLAVPMFLLAGNLMNSLGITNRIFDFASACVRSIPGGLAHVNVFASVIFAGMSGSAIADAGGLGKVEIKAMNDAGYRRRHSAAVTAASSLIGPIIPPSIVMVVYSFLTEESLGRLFLAGILPGLLMAFSMMFVIYLMANRDPEGFPRLERATFAEIWKSLRGAVLPILAPVILVAGVLSGIFTPTESGVVAVLYILLIGTVYLHFRLSHIVEAVIDAARTTAVTLFILAVAVVFAWIVAVANIPELFAAYVTEYTQSPAGVFIVIVLTVMVLGMFMEGIPIMIVFMPTFMTLAAAVGIDLTHLGVVFIVTMMIGGLTPPVGITLYVVMAISKVSLPDFLRSIWPYYIALAAVIALLVIFPQLSLWLPDHLLNTN
ncbi:MAG: TRAP transporter large permease [Gammaproteobacteria bacterium]|nr:MAG: TRAP transporter large permease [Gammaproteobacteria bacterium]